MILGEKDPSVDETEDVDDDKNENYKVVVVEFWRLQKFFCIIGPNETIVLGNVGKNDASVTGTIDINQSQDDSQKSRNSLAIEKYQKKCLERHLLFVCRSLQVCEFVGDVDCHGIHPKEQCQKCVICGEGKEITYWLILEDLPSQ